MTDNQPQQDPITLPLFDELRGQRVILRPINERDAQAYYEAVEGSREHLNDMSFTDRYHSVDDVVPYMRRGMSDWLLRKGMKTHIWHAETGRFLGACGIRPHDWEIRSFEIGYWLRVGATGQGYMTEAVQLVVEYLMDTLQAQRITIRCDENNQASASVARRLGFVYEGTTRNALSRNDKLINAMVFSLIPQDRQK
jgi:RimJ/RimL family protein N-acetyltransferase